MKHLKLFEGYFVDKRKKLIDDFIQLKKEFEHELTPYIQMISDEFDEFDEFDESVVEWGKGTTIAGLHRVEITTKFSPRDLDRIIKVYIDVKTILDQKDDYDVQLHVITKDNKFGKDIIYDYDRIINNRERLKIINTPRNKKILSIITITEKNLEDNI